MTLHIGTVTLCEFEGYLLLALDGAWKNVLGKIVTLDVSIDSQGKLHIVSK